MKRLAISAALLVAAAFVSAPATAKDITSGGLTINEVVTWLQDAG